MKESTSISVMRYISGDYYIDIVTNNETETREAWLQHKNYGISELMFGLEVKAVSPQRFIEIVEENLEQYKEDYADEYFEGEGNDA